jgi:predicted outer membrane repeat protein
MVYSDSVEIVDSRFVDNTSPFGSALYAAYSWNLSIEGCLFSGNHWDDASAVGGAVVLLESSGRISGSTFSANTGASGGALYLYNSIADVNGCEFTGNTAVGGGWGSGGGGAIAALEAHDIGSPHPQPYAQHLPYTLNVANCAFSENAAEVGDGGAINASLIERLSVINSTFTGNSSGDGGAIHCESLDSIDIASSIFWDNGDVSIPSGNATVTYCDVQGGYAGEGNIDADPLFVGAAGGDLRLQAGSPCVDTGLTSALPADAFDLDGDGDTGEPIPYDLDGNDRVVGAAVDMGAYEIQP